MNSIFVPLLSACLAVAGASAQAAQAQQSPTKKEDASTLKKEPPGVVCATADRTRLSEKKRDRKPETGMPSKVDGSDCPETTFAPKKPTA